jgi:hypothetical protein
MIIFSGILFYFVTLKHFQNFKAQGHPLLAHALYSDQMYHMNCMIDSEYSGLAMIVTLKATANDSPHFITQFTALVQV